MGHLVSVYGSVDKRGERSLVDPQTSNHIVVCHRGRRCTPGSAACAKSVDETLLSDAEDASEIPTLVLLGDDRQLI